MIEPNEKDENQNPEQNPMTPAGYLRNKRQKKTQKGTDRHNSRTQPRQYPPVYKRIFIFLRDKENQPLIANLVAIGILFVTAVLAWYTYRLFRNASEDSRIANTSAKAATRSADIAKQTLDSISTYNTKSLAKQQAALDSSSASNRQIFKRENKLLALQDSSLKETQKQFDQQNEPFLAVFNIQQIKLVPYVPLSFKFTVYNYGKFPITLTDEADKVRIVSAKDSAKAIMGIKFPDLKTTSGEVVITQSNPFESSFVSSLSYNKEIVDGFGEKKMIIIFYGRIKYTSNINGKKREYDYIITIRDASDGSVFIFPRYAKNFYVK